MQSKTTQGGGDNATKKKKNCRHTHTQPHIHAQSTVSLPFDDAIGAFGATLAVDAARCRFSSRQSTIACSMFPFYSLVAIPGKGAGSGGSKISPVLLNLAKNPSNSKEMG